MDASRSTGDEARRRVMHVAGFKPAPGHRHRASIAVFAKAPVPGFCKTRLAAVLGARAAARVQKRLADRALRTAVSSGFTATLWGAPDVRHPSFARARAAHGVSLRRQSGRDLGRRMARALREGLRHADCALVVGTDCAAMTTAVLEDSVRVLESGTDAVFVPACDGGYVLVGVRRSLPGLFQRIAWGSARVMEQSRGRARRMGLAWAELAPLCDVDDYRDWLVAKRRGWL